MYGQIRRTCTVLANPKHMTVYLVISLPTISCIHHQHMHTVQANHLHTSCMHNTRTALTYPHPHCPNPPTHTYHTHTHTFNTQNPRTHTHTHAHQRTHTHTYLYIYTHAHPRTHTYIFIYIHAHTRVTHPRLKAVPVEAHCLGVAVQEAKIGLEVQRAETLRQAGQPTRACVGKGAGFVFAHFMQEADDEGLGGGEGQASQRGHEIAHLFKLHRCA